MANNENPRLEILNSEYESFENNPLRSFHNGHTGSAHEQLIYIRNKHPGKWFTHIKLKPVVIGGYDDTGEFGTTGFSVKTLYGRRRPTEAEWDMVRSQWTTNLQDIGSCESADTFTNHPIWVRIYCPGNTPAHIRENIQLQLTYFVKEVGVCIDPVEKLTSENYSTGPFAIYGTSASGDSLGVEGYFYPIYLTEEAARIASDIDEIHVHTFEEFPGAIFFMPTDLMVHGAESYGTYELYSNPVSPIPISSNDNGDY